MAFSPLTVPHQLSRRDLLLASAVTAVATLPFAAPSATAAANTGFDAHVMLAKPWQPGLDPAGYWVSEKLDGVRALWDGQRLCFRSGRPIAAPGWFVAALPATPLDGELWMGRRSFDVLSGTVRTEVPLDAQWQALRYMVFDAPELNVRFTQRLQRVALAVQAAGKPWLQAVAQTTVADAAALQQRLQEVTAGGGEGLVLHHGQGLWMPGRSDAVRKLKAEPDEEGQVLAHLPGSGKYQGRMGALLLETPQGQRFALGSGFSDAERADPPAVGSVVTYRYRGRTAAGLPKFASFVRVRGPE